MSFPASLLYFQPQEFDEPDQIDPVVLTLLDRMRQIYGEPFVIQSDARNAAHNKAVGGTPTSLHLFDPAAKLLCRALDWTIDFGEKPACWEKLDRIVGAWRACREKVLLRGTELEIVFSDHDRHLHIGVFPPPFRPHRLIVRAD